MAVPLVRDGRPFTQAPPKRCKKCGSDKDPKSVEYRPRFYHTACQPGLCPNDEHLHLTCACGFSGIAPCADAKELGEPMDVVPEPTMGWFERLLVNVGLR